MAASSFHVCLLKRAKNAPIWPLRLTLHEGDGYKNAQARMREINARWMPENAPQRRLIKQTPETSMPLNALHGLLCDLPRRMRVQS